MQGATQTTGGRVTCVPNNGTSGSSAILLVDKTYPSHTADRVANCKGICPPKVPRRGTVERHLLGLCPAFNHLSWPPFDRFRQVFGAAMIAGPRGLGILTRPRARGPAAEGLLLRGKVGERGEESMGSGFIDPWSMAANGEGAVARSETYHGAVAITAKQKTTDSGSRLRRPPALFCWGQGRMGLIPGGQRGTLANWRPGERPLPSTPRFCGFSGRRYGGQGPGQATQLRRL